MAKLISTAKVRHYWPLYLFIVPSLVFVLLFKYYTAGSAFYHAFRRWNGDYIDYPVGLENFVRFLGRPGLWTLAVAVLWALIVLARRRGWARDVIRLVAGLWLPVVNAWVLLPASRPADGLATGISPLATAACWAGIAIVSFLVTSRGGRARMAWVTLTGTVGLTATLRACGIHPNLAWSLGLFSLGCLLWGLPGLRTRRTEEIRTLHAFAAMGVILWSLAIHAGGDEQLWKGFGVISILVIANVFKLVPTIITAVVIHRLKSDRANYWYRVLFVVPMIIPPMVNLLLWKFFFQPQGLLNLILAKSGIMALLGRLDAVFGWDVFVAGTAPVWLGSEALVIPAMIIWGVPWVGVVGVLIYLAGLQSIDKDLYEAADVDGITSLGKLFHIELPLILTQVRITLVLMVIGTLQGYAHIMILFGNEGGPNGKLMIPGLYMFRNAFIEGYSGQACCIGLIIFVFILILTEINNRFVRVEK